tara:strand:- start:1265 stop:1510 length:246 start_codon:yes stop_codon:yes gene_type:complete
MNRQQSYDPETNCFNDDDAIEAWAKEQVLDIPNLEQKIAPTTLLELIRHGDFSEVYEDMFGDNLEEDYYTDKAWVESFDRF